jgi:polysaccharide biosynthesis protein PslG
MPHIIGRRPHRRMLRRLTPAVFVLLILVPALVVAASACSSGGSQNGDGSTAGTSGLLRGIFDDAWVKASAAERATILKDLATDLHVQVVRMDLRWSLAEPSAAGQYDMTYLGNLKAAAVAARQAGMRVMIDVFGVPTWASDQTYWIAPPAGYKKGYQDFYPVAAGHLKDWQATAAYLAHTFKGKVSWWECWNEPNMWLYMYPQTKAGEPMFAAEEYVKLLKRFSTAVHGADPAAKVLGGVTAPFGADNQLRTSPQTFLSNLKVLGAAKWWDGVSHHPYTPAGVMPMPKPLARPQFPQLTVTLGNIQTLLKMFPSEPFYLTEYGYPTQASMAWGSAYVTDAQQAAYLTTAYRDAAGLEQVKLLSWFLWKDIDAGADNPGSAYFGLRRADGTKKPSWSAYARLR